MHDITADADRFWSKVDTSGDCWLWLGATNDNGYGRFAVGRRRLMAHRVAHELGIGPIPAGLQVDHLCRVRLCVNPDHLEAVTQYVNIMRSEAPTALNARRSTCIHGHPFDSANTYVTPDGRRQCRICIRTRLARHATRRVA